MVISTTAPVSEAEYQVFALSDPQGHWELHRGQLREKPGMSAAHDNVIDRLQRRLYMQLGEHEYRLRSNNARLRVSAETYYVPDLAVVPTELVQSLLEGPNTLDAYSDPLPLVIEIWSPSTGVYDIKDKLPDYQQRGDREIWFIHPYERTLTAWRRREDGSYAQAVYATGTVRPESLPGVAIDLEALFAP